MTKGFGLPKLTMALVLAATLGPMAVTSLVYGQAVTGTLLGTVTDPNNAVVAGATITITEVHTNIRRSAPTNENGNYAFDNLSMGTALRRSSRVGSKCRLTARRARIYSLSLVQSQNK